MWSNLQETFTEETFTKEILNEKTSFFVEYKCFRKKAPSKIFDRVLNKSLLSEAVVRRFFSK